MATPGSIVEQGGNQYRVDEETYTYYDTVVTTQTRTDFTGFDDVPICRPKILYFKVTDLRPNTRHFVYFDKVDVSNYINTSISSVDEFKTLPRNDPKRNPGDKYINATGFPTELGGPTTPILSDASGTIEGIFYLQSNATLNFPTGKRTMSFIDINLLDPSRALSFASTTFTVDGGIENYATNYYTTSQQVARTGTRNTLTFIGPVVNDTEFFGDNTLEVDEEVGSSGGTVVPGTGTGEEKPIDTGQGVNTNANDNATQQQDDDDDAFDWADQPTGSNVDLPGNVISRFLGIEYDADNDGDTTDGDDGCVIATHGVATGGFTKLEKAKAVLWCEKKYHGTFFGEALRRGYKYTASKAIERGDAEKYYQEFKDFVNYGRGIKKGFKYGVNYYYRTLYFIAHGLFIKH